VAALEGDVDLRPRRPHLLAERDELVVREHRQCRDHDDDADDDPAADWHGNSHGKSEDGGSKIEDEE
jgi:hypothetical protein